MKDSTEKDHMIEKMKVFEITNDNVDVYVDFTFLETKQN
jgi:hypothetical protein